MKPSLHYTIRQEAIELLWNKRSMLPEDSEEIIEDVLNVVEKHVGPFDPVPKVERSL